MNRGGGWAKVSDKHSARAAELHADDVYCKGSIHQHWKPAGITSEISLDSTH